MHTDSEMTGISRSGSMHYMTAASLEMSDEPHFLQYKGTIFSVPVFRFMQFEPDNAAYCSKKLFINLRTINFFINFAAV